VSRLLINRDYTHRPAFADDKSPLHSKSPGRVLSANACSHQPIYTCGMSESADKPISPPSSLDTVRVLFFATVNEWVNLRTRTLLFVDDKKKVQSLGELHPNPSLCG
jgi:hypothetical protein